MADKTAYVDARAMTDNLIAMARYAPEVAKDVLFYVAHEIRIEAQKIAPFENGDLVRAMKVYVDPKGNWAMVYNNMEYAAVQHENLLYKHYPGKSAKYIEIPLMHLGMTDFPRKVASDILQGITPRRYKHP